jgi:peptidoglycan/LPS O-acetylase OafA/YrhL
MRVCANAANRQREHLWETRCLSNIVANAVTATAANREFDNFDALRLLAAVSVIFSHAFVIAEGTEVNEPLVRLLGPGNILGAYGVFIFFVVSGFLVCRSFERSRLDDYLRKRMLRIFPGLAACAFLVGAAGAATLSLVEGRIAGVRPATKYFVASILLADTSGQGLPGLLFSANRFGKNLNGSLWSLGPEFACYVAVALLGVLGVLRTSTAVALLLLGLLTQRADILGNVGYVFAYFAAGALMFYWERRPPLRPWSALIAITGLMASAAIGLPQQGFALFGAWLVIAIGTSTQFQLHGLTRPGDLTYGLYLYGWPVEQALRFLIGPMAQWWQLFALALPIAAVCAFASWHLVEAPAIRLGRRWRWELS